MARSANQKLKLLYLMRYLLRNSDENHPVTVRQMGEYLRGQGISAERKSLYDDIEALQQFGLDIIQVKDGNFYGYYVGSRDFELPELKLLVDSVQSSKFITHKKTRSLIEKIERLGSVHEADQLRRQVFVANRIKTMNESIYYNVDEIHTGIAQDRKIRFRYFDYTVAKERQFRHDGAFYEVSPYALTWVCNSAASLAKSVHDRTSLHITPLILLITAGIHFRFHFVFKDYLSQCFHSITPVRSVSSIQLSKVYIT